MTDGPDRPGGNPVPDPRAYEPTIPSGMPAEPRPPVPGGGFGGPGQPVQPWTSTAGAGGQGGQGRPGEPAPSADWPTQMAGSGGPPAPSSAPDWQALADQHEDRQRRRKWKITAIVAAAAVALGAAVGFAVLDGLGGDEDPQSDGSPTASASASPSPSASKEDKNSPLVPGEANLLADKSGQAHLALGPDALVTKVPNGHVIRLRSNPNSFAQSADQVVDVKKSFTVSAWAQNEGPGGTRMAISQGDGVSYSFELGRDDDHGKLSWVFRVQTGDKGADSTARQVRSKGKNTVNTWALLTGVYDAEKGTITLYVDGVKAASAKSPAVWSGPGPLQLGRSRHHSIWGNPWAGVVGHVMVWDNALDASQVAALKKGSGLTENPSASWLVG